MSRGQSLRQVYSTLNLAEAYLVRDRLAAAGIRTFVFNEHSAGALGELPYTESWPQVWIYQDLHYERARRLLAEYETQGATGEGTRQCAGCGEQSPASFELCWRCGHDLVS